MKTWKAARLKSLPGLIQKQNEQLLLTYLLAVSVNDEASFATKAAMLKAIDDIKNYVDENCVPGGTNRNWDSYGKKIGPLTELERSILADPQTSGGLLIAVAPQAVEEVKHLLVSYNLYAETIGFMKAQNEKAVHVELG